MKHPNIVEYKDSFLCEDSTVLCLVMDFAAGGDLKQQIRAHAKQGTRFAERDVWAIAIQVLRGLKTMHESSVLHRDVKSANLFVYDDGVVKIGDLNVSKVVGAGLSHTQAGTPYYASPEVWRDQPYDEKSDIWSLGCVLYELMALQTPFRGDSMLELYKKVIQGKVPPLSSD